MIRLNLRKESEMKALSWMDGTLADGYDGLLTTDPCHCLEYLYLTVTVLDWQRVDIAQGVTQDSVEALTRGGRDSGYKIRHDLSIKLAQQAVAHNFHATSPSRDFANR